MSACRSCEEPIEWGKTTAGRPTPLNLDGTPHWSTCPHAKDWRRPKAGEGGRAQPGEEGAPLATASDREIRPGGIHPMPMHANERAMAHGPGRQPLTLARRQEIDAMLDDAHAYFDGLAQRQALDATIWEAGGAP